MDVQLVVFDMAGTTVYDGDAVNICLRDALQAAGVASLARLGWMRDGLVDVTVSSDEVAQGRPAPDLIYRAMQRTGITEASRVAKVGDTPSDLQEGQAAGCGWIIGVTAGSHTQDE